MPLRLRSLIVCFWLTWLAGTLAHAAPTVVIVSSESSVAYVEAAGALVDELERGGVPRIELLQVTVAEFAVAGQLTPKLFVALGSEAANALAKAELRTPVLCTLLPRSSFERALLTNGRKASPQFSALYLDQPLSRQLELIRLALPAARRVGVLWGDESQAQAPALKALAQARGLELAEATVGSNELLFPGLKRVLEDADLLLAVPDHQLYNSSNIQNILLASFRARVPLVAFSPAYVRAGALLALHVTPRQIGQQAAAIVRGVLQGKTLSATPLYSQDFSVAVNEHVARSLGLTLEPDALRARLRRREGAL
ncbi:MAG: ABC transporter substrate binding protein [Rhodoferax sp.]|uniref:ABC transporter substrate-binding protein n=1 Tax=Rhodoferax sp. TaxID=50421 RepID=UPI00271C6F16|nr:ABC transporter substrate binding protein [Rhodoferax sp.]MDO8449043.1 ABC transporter substrate binding protein [Rhodoferax sp.]